MSYWTSSCQRLASAGAPANPTAESEGNRSRLGALRIQMAEVRPSAEHSFRFHCRSIATLGFHGVANSSLISPRQVRSRLQGARPPS